MSFDTNEFLNQLEPLINTDSGSFNIEGCHLVLDFFEKEFKNIGLETELIYTGSLSRPVLTAHTPGLDSFDFYLGGHVDTVFEDGTASARPFTVDCEKAFGPGTVDMKAGDLLILYLAKELVLNHPDISFCVVLNSDEEIGAADTKDIMIDCASKCKAAFIFEGGRKQGQFVNMRKGIAKYSLEIKGIPSHAGTAPWQGVSAVSELAHWITNLNKLNDYKKGLTLNVGIIEGGNAVNVVPAHAKALFEIRYHEDKTFKKAEVKLNKMAAKPFTEGTTVTLTTLSHYPPLRLTDKTRKVMELLEPLNLHYVKAGGTSDANRIAEELDIPIIDGCGPMGGFPHSEKEFLLIPTVEERFNLMIRIFTMLKEGLA